MVELGDGEDVDHAFSGDSAGDDLADGVVEFVARAAVAGGEFTQGNADGLEEGDVIGS